MLFQDLKLHIYYNFGQLFKNLFDYLVQNTINWQSYCCRIKIMAENRKQNNEIG